MTPKLHTIAGSVKKAVQLVINPLFFPERNWDQYERPAIERLKGVDLREWQKVKARKRGSTTKLIRGSLDQLI